MASGLGKIDRHRAVYRGLIWLQEKKDFVDYYYNHLFFICSLIPFSSSNEKAICYKHIKRELPLKK
jgi:hypothetical protein